MQTDSAVRLIRLVAGDLQLDLAPALGGAVASFAKRGRPVLRLPHAAPVHADQLACFPLVPFSNRIRDGRFAYAGREILVPRNHFAPHPLHGDGWTSPWREVESGPNRALLRHRHEPGPSWPWRYCAEQHIHLDSDGLAIELSLTNEDRETFPAGLGLHPFFPRAGARLTAPATGIWESTPDRLPLRTATVPPEWDFSRPRAIEGLDIDHCFRGWSGEALIEWPDRSCRLTAGPGIDKLVIYVPPDGDLFCVEPVGNVTDGFNLRARGVPDSGVEDVAPGARLALRTRFDLAGSW